MPRFQLLKREHSSGPKKMVSMRLPERLMKELERIAEDQGGLSVTDLFVTAADQLVQWERESDRKGGKG
jgi:hypothetical protein